MRKVIYRLVIGVLLFGLSLIGPVSGAATKTTTKAKAKSTATSKALKPSCQPDLASCADEGCGTDFDPNLNKQKNIRQDDPRTQGVAAVKTLQEMKDLADPENFTKGGSRDELTALGEGQKIEVLAYLLIARDEPGGESCNCGLHSIEETDNHLVLVSKTTVDTFPLQGTTKAELAAVLHQREPESITAEFTPRVRLDSAHPHPNFIKKTLDPLINKASERALLVRVTGMQMFDSEHFIRNHLVRVNNWEIHPVLKMEFCTTGTNCKVGSDAGWESIDDIQ
jgi:hypothetical protein